MSQEIVQMFEDSQKASSKIYSNLESSKSNKHSSGGTITTSINGTNNLNIKLIQNNKNASVDQTNRKLAFLDPNFNLRQKNQQESNNNKISANSNTSENKASSPNHAYNVSKIEFANEFRNEARNNIFVILRKMEEMKKEFCNFIDDNINSFLRNSEKIIDILAAETEYAFRIEETNKVIDKRMEILFGEMISFFEEFQENFN